MKCALSKKGTKFRKKKTNKRIYRKSKKIGGSSYVNTIPILVKAKNTEFKPIQTPYFEGPKKELRGTKLYYHRWEDDVFSEEIKKATGVNSNNPTGAEDSDTLYEWVVRNKGGVKQMEINKCMDAIVFCAREGGHDGADGEKPLWGYVAKGSKESHTENWGYFDFYAGFQIDDMLEVNGPHSKSIKEASNEKSMWFAPFRKHPPPLRGRNGTNSISSSTTLFKSLIQHGPKADMNKLIYLSQIELNPNSFFIFDWDRVLSRAHGFFYPHPGGGDPFRPDPKYNYTTPMDSAFDKYKKEHLKFIKSKFKDFKDKYGTWLGDADGRVPINRFETEFNKFFTKENVLCVLLGGYDKYDNLKQMFSCCTGEEKDILEELKPRPRGYYDVEVTAGKIRHKDSINQKCFIFTEGPCKALIIELAAELFGWSLDFANNRVFSVNETPLSDIIQKIVEDIERIQHRKKNTIYMFTKNDEKNVPRIIPPSNPSSQKYRSTSLRGIFGRA
jgi:hypothetical protein